MKVRRPPVYAFPYICSFFFSFRLDLVDVTYFRRDREIERKIERERERERKKERNQGKKRKRETNKEKEEEEEEEREKKDGRIVIAHVIVSERVKEARVSLALLLLCLPHRSTRISRHPNMLLFLFLLLLLTFSEMEEEGHRPQWKLKERKRWR